MSFFVEKNIYLLFQEIERKFTPRTGIVNSDYVYEHFRRTESQKPICINCSFFEWDNNFVVTNKQFIKDEHNFCYFKIWKADEKGNSLTVFCSFEVDKGITITNVELESQNKNKCILHF